MILAMGFQLVCGKMKNNKFLITINNLEDIEKLKELGITNYVFPLKNFCVGIPNTFLVSEIPCNGFLLINRILDNDGIDELKNVLNNLSDNIKGIIFDDLGVYEIIKDLKVEKILYLSHFNTNSESVNLYLDLVDSVILSTDITLEEIKEIIKNSKKEISLFTYGYVGVMYSRRLLIDNYCKYHKLPYENPIIIENTNKKFLIYENEFGTYFYYDKVFNGCELLDLNGKYYFVNSTFLDINTIIDLVKCEEVENSDKGFLYKETIYKLKGDENV